MGQGWEMPADGTRAAAAVPSDALLSGRTHGLRSLAGEIAARQAEQLKLVATLLAECRADVPGGGRGISSSSDAEAMACTLAEAELSVTLGISGPQAARMLVLADRVVRVLPQALQALRDGRIDLPRVSALAQATEVLADPDARQVASVVLADAGERPWQGPSPRAWRARVERAVVAADLTAAERRRQLALAARQVRAWAEPDGMGVLQVRAGAADVAMIDQVVTDLATSLPSVDADGSRRTLDQRRTDAVVEVFRRIRGHSLAETTEARAAIDAPLPRVPVRAARDIGLVLHADTLFRYGPAARALGEQRGLGRPAPLDPRSASREASRQLAGGTGLQVLVVDDTGALQRLVPLSSASAGGDPWTRAALIDAVQQALPRLGSLSPLSTARYAPTSAIAAHVRAEAATCSFYDCPRQSRACDLDHDEPWPRGPTAVTNLDPKCRRHHQLKTHRLVRSDLLAGPGRGPRRVSWSMTGGLSVTTTALSLPGCADEPPGRPRAISSTVGWMSDGGLPAEPAKMVG
ncbi:DUF222 domain-containing protein [Angustibacter sp. McL0619]|uniref:HNH endonuclease signature motif containing protein n=1 Tax=Angustibacter sp. McL0619 TaxID=3415676 RepID=UPI003CED026D